MAGVTVGHCTPDAGGAQTGATVVLANGGALLRDQVPAASMVINKLGKSIGLLQTVHTVGALVLATCGRLPQLVLAGHTAGTRLAALVTRSTSQPIQGQP